MSEDEALELLRWVLRQSKWRIHKMTLDEAVDALHMSMVLYGGDNTCRLMCHYHSGKLKDMIRQESSCFME